MITAQNAETGHQTNKKALKQSRKTNIALVCTRGGHFEQMMNLSDFFSRYDHFWITNRNKQTESQLKRERAYYIEMAHFKKPWTYLYQLAPLFRVFAREKPTHVLSTGSGRTAFVPFLLARLFKIKFLYIDTFSRVHGHSKFGTFLLKTKNTIYTQWKDTRNENTVYIGPIFKPPPQIFKKRYHSKYVFVAAGTRDEPFTRLIKGVEDLVKKGVIKEKVVVQAGHTKYGSDCLDIFDFCGPEKIDDLILNAKYVITQESAGIGTQCLRYKTKFIVMPRRYEYGELPTKTDMKEDLHYRLEELGYTAVVRNTNELEQAVLNIHRLKTGFEFNNSMAISNLHKALEEA